MNSPQKKNSLNSKACKFEMGLWSFMHWTKGEREEAKKKKMPFLFQEPGDIEAEFAQLGVRKVITKSLTYRTPGPLFFPKGKGFGDSPDTPVVLPPWLTEEDVEYNVSKFEKSGFTGGVNYYRAFNLWVPTQLCFLFLGTWFGWFESLIFLTWKLQKLATYCTMDWITGESTCQVCCWGTRPNLPYPWDERIHTQWWVSEICAILARNCSDQRCSLYYSRKTRWNKQTHLRLHSQVLSPLRNTYIYIYRERGII